jgi:hypothetical protein
MLNTKDFFKNRNSTVNLTGPIKPIKKFKKTGNQGIAEIIEINGKNMVTKVSQYIDFVTRHEYIVMKGLNNMSSYCPHFCKVYELKEMELGKRYEKMPTIFYKPDDDERVKMDVLFMEYIPSALSLASGILTESISKRQLFSCLKQVIVAIKMAQLKMNFTHYDLHTDNILLLPIEKTSFSLYVFENENFLLPTYGILPIIIDFGFSYCNSLKNTNFYSTLEHTNRGYCPFTFDFFNDIKILLLNVIQDNLRIDNAYDLEKFQKLIFSIFGKLTIDIESGWDDLDGPSLNGHVADSIHSISRKLIKTDKHPFIQFPNFCVDMLSTLIKLPFKKNPNVKSTIKTAFTMFLREFEKINTQKKYKTLKQLVEISGKYKEPYEKNQPYIIHRYKKELDTTIGTYNINPEKILCSLISLSKRMENNFVENSTELFDFKQDQQNILHSEKIFDVLDLYYHIEMLYNPDKFKFNNDSKLYIWNMLTKTNSSVNLTLSDIQELNSKRDIKDQTNFLYKKYVK